MLWTVAVARLVLGPQMSIQAPPNLNAGELARLVGAGINDWGGVSPVTEDHVNPVAPWPQLDHLDVETRRAGRVLTQRLGRSCRVLREKHRAGWTRRCESPCCIASIPMDLPDGMVGMPARAMLRRHSRSR
jgi:hypothetical protein